LDNHLKDEIDWSQKAYGQLF